MKKIFVLVLLASSSVLHGAQDCKDAESKRASGKFNDWIINIGKVPNLGNLLIIEEPKEQQKTDEVFSTFEKAAEFLAPYMDQELVRNMNAVQQKILQSIQSDNQKELLAEEIATAVILASSNRFSAPALGKNGLRFFQLHAEYLRATAAVLEDAQGRVHHGIPGIAEQNQLILIDQKIKKLEENAEAIETMLGNQKRMNEWGCTIL